MKVKTNLCQICGEPALIWTKVKNNEGKYKIGSCSRYHQLLIRDRFVRQGYEYNEQKGRYEK